MEQDKIAGAQLVAAIVATAPERCYEEEYIKEEYELTLYDVIKILRNWHNYTSGLERDIEALQEMVDAYEKD